MERTASLPYAPAKTAPFSIVGFNHVRRAVDPDNNLFAALLAIAGHDLRQPLQFIRGAHDILAKTLDGVVEWVQLARVEDANSKLGDTLDQLADTLRMFDPASSAGSEIVQLGPLFTLSTAELAEAASRNGLTLRIMPTRSAVSSNTVLLSGILRNLIRERDQLYARRGTGDHRRPTTRSGDPTGAHVLSVAKNASLVATAIIASDSEGPLKALIGR